MRQYNFRLHQGHKDQKFENFGDFLGLSLKMKNCLRFFKNVSFDSDQKLILCINKILSSKTTLGPFDFIFLGNKPGGRSKI
jgi:hypothetical protein